MKGKRKRQQKTGIAGLWRIMGIVFGASLAAFFVQCNTSDPITAGNDKNVIFEGSNPGNVMLTWLAPWEGEGSKELMMRDIARNYEFLNQKIHIQQKFTGDVYDDFWWSAVSAGIAEMIKKDEWPFDIMVCEKGHYQVVAGLVNDPDWPSKYFVDFSKEDWFTEAHREGLLTSPSILKTYRNIIPGPLLEGTIYVLYTSTEVEEK
ncbi:MAG TPA: hypothetical protein PLK12_15930, partial [Prolixibacteraceae bacterium]|nr:hypothetical protein [Prolixibacteraceae bacterium]